MRKNERIEQVKTAMGFLELWQERVDFLGNECAYTDDILRNARDGIDRLLQEVTQ